MSILKAILHHYNSKNKNYDTLHPETESAQITDWHSGIMASLASKTLGTVVDAVATDSVLGKLVKLLLNASGVKYLIDTNGYICFGSFFGGLIIQWGIATPSGAAPWQFAFPLAFPNSVFTAALTRRTGGNCYSVVLRDITTKNLTWVDYSPSGLSGAGDYMCVIVVGR